MAYISELFILVSNASKIQKDRIKLFEYTIGFS